MASSSFGAAARLLFPWRCFACPSSSLIFPLKPFVSASHNSRSQQMAFFASVPSQFSSTGSKVSASSQAAEILPAFPVFSSSSSFLFRNESLPAKIYRWADITGFLTRWNDRKAWILDLEPSNRLATTQITEHERKLSIFMVTNSLILFIFSIYFWIQAQFHFAVKPPCPQPPDLPYLNNLRNDFTWHSKIPPGIYPRDRCKECRWLDSNCKRLCFDRLKAEGHKFFIHGEKGPLSRSRFDLEPPHHH
ncbi:hypothetical protein IE077_004544 [Cardiosporidium cionae]|uniref:Uncharacterized protein n=1 Tax=Cardiosporidium cionae TaxID=476202 RepID=A0ABQ7JEU7_9APIC|nr:hypothetical protein IE077_004544 [Cardiosporidium cionae]|eukprot:KAF8822523.1 hypothetical protein IE077_004544 [Cardiosporidium cionae]